MPDENHEELLICDSSALGPDSAFSFQIDLESDLVEVSKSSCHISWKLEPQRVTLSSLLYEGLIMMTSASKPVNHFSHRTQYKNTFLKTLNNKSMIKGAT